MAESTAAYKEANPGVPVKNKLMKLKICLWMRASFRICEKRPEICGWGKQPEAGYHRQRADRFRYDVMLRVNKKHARKRIGVLHYLCKRADIHGRMVLCVM
ncbi:hypothetical protein P7H17_02150 [Paenibacillus larvae]|nr:hypothetical protein [Paenibacillus larvae]MDT2285149.1 hypothetical protein [Paenibacillus larvae]